MSGIVRPPTGGSPWLVVIDMQAIFGDPSSQWAAPRYDEIVPNVRRLVEHFDDRVVFTRYLAPEHPEGAWAPYFELWLFALDPENAPLYELSPGTGFDGQAVVDRERFGKWDAEFDEAIAGTREVVMVGVSTDCCVMSTALPMSDAGVHVRIVTDACAGASDTDHRRALDAMALYAPLIELTTTDAVLTAAAPNAAAPTAGV